MSTPGDPTQFTRESAERIGRVVRAAELSVPQARALAFDRVDGPARKVFRVCTFTGSWAINTDKVVTFRGVTSTPNTVSATNLFSTVGGNASSTKNCAIARDGAAWYLIAAECP